ncbi:hypothetical protein [Amycolatopsis acidicola]|uniref:hypothetical protein n=1 Tax=Amycolatopsis acidicola TaxID=2596893 RepID=UPI001AA097CA|nr:hypothetical protein [Amycolatopsis acidicola]
MLDSEAIAGPLQVSVHQRLDDLARSAGLADEEHATELARREIPLLVQALRAVLAAHEPDARGRCRICRGQSARRLFRRGNRMPCRAYLAVQLRLGTIEAAFPQHRHSKHHHHRRATHLHSVS